MGRYKNPYLRNSRRSIWDLVLWKMGYYADPEIWEPSPNNFSYPVSPPPFQREKPSVVWIGHSTFLIEVDGLKILTDPVWDDFCSPIPFPSLKRKVKPPFSLAELPPIDLVLLSHNHYDHLDAKTVKYLKAFHPNIKWIVPQGVGRWFKKRGVESVFELGWWETYQTSRYSVAAVPAQHFSGRTLWDKNQTLWNGYVFETSGKRLYFTGDTGYNPNDFKAIGKNWAGMDLSLIPIGTYSPKAFMETVHISPYEAVEIHRDVRSIFSIGMHWKTFRLSEEPLDRPPYDLFLAMKEKDLPYESFLPIEIGLYVNW